MVTQQQTLNRTTLFSVREVTMNGEQNSSRLGSLHFTGQASSRVANSLARSSAIMEDRDDSDEIQIAAQTEKGENGEKHAI